MQAEQTETKPNSELENPTLEKGHDSLSRNLNRGIRPNDQVFGPNDDAVMKREPSNQKLDEVASKAKKKACLCRSRSETENHLKQLFIEEVMKDKMCMEEFAKTAIEMGFGESISEYVTGEMELYPNKKEHRGVAIQRRNNQNTKLPPGPSMLAQSTQSEESEYSEQEILSFLDCCCGIKNN